MKKTKGIIVGLFAGLLFVGAMQNSQVANAKVYDFKILSGSMYPTLKTDSTHYFKKVKDFSEIERFDVVSFKIDASKLYPDYTLKSDCPILVDVNSKCFKLPLVNYTKRAIGMPGDKISFSSDALIISINDEVIDLDLYTPTKEEILAGNKEMDIYDMEHGFNYFKVSYKGKEFTQVTSQNYMKNFEDTTIQLKDDEFFVMGDNRTFSKDSRNFGVIKGSRMNYVMVN